MKNLILLSLIFSFIFVGCTPKTQIVFKDKFVCIEQQKIDRSSVDIRVHKEDFKVALAYKDALDSNFSFYEKQVDRNNKFCEGIK